VIIRPLTKAEAMTVPGMSDPMPESMTVLGAVDEQGVAAACGVYFVVHADPIWVRRDHRNGGRLLLRLWEATRDFVRQTKMGQEVVVGMTPTNPGPGTEELVERMCLWAGGSELKARFFAIPMETMDLPVEE
jgi:hypothetical protein